MNDRHRSARRGAAIALVAVAAFGVSACGGEANTPAADAVIATAAPAPADTPGFGLISPSQALELSTTDGVTVIDVRTPEEFAEGHIDGATMIDFYADTFADQLGALDPDGTYLLYCRSGNRSGQAAALMQQLGFQQVYDMEGGVVAYGQLGLPLVR